ncbi:MAG: hypothetical protein M3Y08_03080 [Fibrobacterota bacterium]|nr:hypothetical protein [Fibrobacterota bacterium]
MCRSDTSPMVRHIVGRILILGLTCPLFLAALLGCGDRSTSPNPRPPDEGLWIIDSGQTLDEFPFRAAACAEVFPSGSVNSDSQPSGAVAAVRIVSTACYHIRVFVVDSAQDTLRTFTSRFGILNRTDEEKHRGVVGFVAWNGKDDQGCTVAAGRYLWRMEFDFGAGRIRKFRADIILP